MYPFTEFLNAPLAILQQSTSPSSCAGTLALGPSFLSDGRSRDDCFLSSEVKKVRFPDMIGQH